MLSGDRWQWVCSGTWAWWSILPNFIQLIHCLWAALWDLRCVFWMLWVWPHAGIGVMALSLLLFTASWYSCWTPSRGWGRNLMWASTLVPLTHPMISLCCWSSADCSTRRYGPPLMSLIDEDWPLDRTSCCTSCLCPTYTVICLNLGCICAR